MGTTARLDPTAAVPRAVSDSLHLVGCSFCPEDAECWFDDEPVCLDCADLMLERLTAIGIAGRNFVGELPSISDRVPGL